MEVKVHTKPSAWQKLLGKEGIGSIEFMVAGADHTTIRALRPLVPVDKEHIGDFNPLAGSLQFEAKPNKKMLEFLQSIREYVTEEELPPNYQEVVNYLEGKSH